MKSKPMYRMQVADEDSATFFIGVMKGYTKYLSKQEFSTMKGQALAGDVEGARRGLNRLLRKKGVLKDEECI